MNWVTAGGREVAIGDMTDLHLFDTIGFLRRRAEYGLEQEKSNAWGALMMFGSGAAVDSIERCIAELDEMGPIEYLVGVEKRYGAMVREAATRRLAGSSDLLEELQRIEEECYPSLFSVVRPVGGKIPF